MVNNILSNISKKSNMISDSHDKLNINMKINDQYIHTNLLELRRDNCYDNHLSTQTCKLIIANVLITNA